jgi:DHA1 family bicyclomycin/chloramphenicol resistance-like MFS transporter
MPIDPLKQRTEFIFILVTLLSVGAFAIDIMLPALPQIASDLGAANANDQQLMITAYLAGFGISQLFYGPLSDSFGRRKILIIGLSLSLVPLAFSPFAPDYMSLLALRFIQGAGTGACRVLVPSIVRDKFEGREMAKVISITNMFYMAAPMIAPSLGQLIIEFGNWQHTFFFLAAIAAIALYFTVFRLPETLAVENKRPFNLAMIFKNFAQVLTNRTAFTLAIANLAMFATVLGFLGLSPQIYLDIYNLGAVYPLMIALTALSISVSSFVNAKLVNYFEPAQIAVSANIAFVGFAALWVFQAMGFGTIPFWLFVLNHQAMMLCFGLVSNNQIAVALQPMGHIAGTASSTIGFFHSAGGAVLGAFIGTFYNGTILPVAIGFLLCGIASAMLTRYGTKTMALSEVNR